MAMNWRRSRSPRASTRASTFRISGPRRITFLEALDEAIDIGCKAGVPVEIYHLKAAGKRNWDKETQAIAKIDAARKAGQDVSACMYALHMRLRRHRVDLCAAAVDVREWQVIR